MTVLFLLLGLTWWSGAAVAHRFWADRGIAERALAALLIAWGEITLVVQVLGFGHVLTRSRLGWGVALLGLSVALAALYKPGRRGSTGRRGSPGWRGSTGRRGSTGWRGSPGWRGAGGATRELGDQLMLPIRALGVAWRARSALWVGVLATIVILVWTTLLSWLAPSGAWDGLWYHEPMVGFALQYRGFRWVELPTHMQWVNGYPRTSEHLMLFVTAFSDRRLIDATQQLVAPVALLALYVLARRHGASRVLAMGAASVMFTIPGLVLQMRSTYADVSVLAAFLSALVFTTGKPFDMRYLWMSALSLGLMGGTKASMPLYVALLIAFALIPAVGLMRREGARPVLAALFGGACLMAVLMAPTFIRNMLRYQNPIWPLRYTIAGIELQGPGDLNHMQWPAELVWRELFAPPVPGRDYHDTRRHAYGYGMSFIGIPMCFGALMLMLFELIVRPRRAPYRLYVIQLLGWLTLVLSPAYHWARFALAAPAAGLVGITWALRRARLMRAGEALLAAMLALNLITLYWAEPGWDVSVRRAFHMLQLPKDARVPVRTSENLPSPELVEWRMAHVHRGDVVAFGDGITFVANLWNERMDNHVVYVPFARAGVGQAYLAQLAEVDAKVAVVDRKRVEARVLTSALGWTRVGAGPADDTWFVRTSSP